MQFCKINNKGLSAFVKILIDYLPYVEWLKQTDRCISVVTTPIRLYNVIAFVWTDSWIVSAKINMDLRVKHVFFQSPWSSNMPPENPRDTLETFLAFTLFLLSSADLHDIDILRQQGIIFYFRNDDCFSS